MKTALNIIKTLVIGFVVWAVALLIIYYIGMFWQWISKILSTEYWQSIIQGAAAITIFGCFIWTIGYVFLYLLRWIKHEIWLKEQGK